MIEKLTIINHCETTCRDFKYWILLSSNINLNKKVKNRSIRLYIQSIMGEENVRWKFQGAGDQYILQLKEQRDYTFFLLKTSGV